MSDPLSLKSVATMVCMRVLLLENPTKISGENKNVAMETGTEIRPYLTKLLQTDCFTAVSEEILYRILRFCPNYLSDDLLHALTPMYVKYLNLKDCTNVHITGLVKIFQKCCHLNKINLSCCPQLICPDIFTFIGLSKLPMTTVIMEENNNVNDDVVHEMLRCLPSLHTLDISSCQNISDRVFLLDEHKQLRREFSVETVKDEEYSCNLTSVDVSGCCWLSCRAVRHLTSLCGPKLTDVNIAVTNINCLALLHIAGYSIETILDFMLTTVSVKSDHELTKYFEEWCELLQLDKNHKKTFEGDTVNDTGDTVNDTGDIVNGMVDPVNDKGDTVNDTGDAVNDTGAIDSIPKITGQEGNEAMIINDMASEIADGIADVIGDDTTDNMIEKFKKGTALGACGGVVCETFDGENDNKVTESRRNSEAPVRITKYYKGNVQVSKETYYCDLRLEQECLANLEKDEEEVATKNSILERGMDTKVKVHQEAASAPVSCDKVNFSTLLFKPKIVKLNIKRIKYDSTEAYLGRLCLEKFLAVNEGLQKFAVSWKGLTFDFFKKIVPKLSELTEVELEECSFLTSAGVKALGMNCRKCKSINLRGVVFINNSGLLPFLENKNLQVLSLAESDRITDDIIIKFSEHLNTSLTDLDLSYCEEVSEKGINAICSTCTQLKRLQLLKCQVSDFSLRLLSQTALDLVEISVENAKISDEDSITDNGILTIANTLRNLRILNISWNLEITDVSVSAILTNCKLLEEAVLTGLKRITIQPFLPIIADYEVGKSCDHNNSERSTVYAQNLRVLDLYYNDLVDDNLLLQIVNVCRGTLEVTDYYGTILEPGNM